MVFYIINLNLCIIITLKFKCFYENSVKTFVSNMNYRY
jgi:hypothetical protein